MALIKKSLESQSQPPRLLFDFIALAIVAVIGVGFYFHKSPIHVIGSNVSVRGTLPPPGPNQADTLLVLPNMYEGREVAGSFQTLDMSLGWFNTLNQEIGDFSHIQVSTLNRGSLTGRRLVIVSAAAARTASLQQIEMLGGWVTDGGTILLEQPSPTWENILPMRIASTMQGARRITAANEVPLQHALRDALLDVPLSTTVRHFEVAPSENKGEASILMEVDGRPALVHVRRGSGHMYVTSIDVARAVMTLQQGRPSSDFRILDNDPDAVPGQTPYVKPHMLVFSPKMLESRTPYADLLERNFIELTSMHRPMPRMWYYPHHYAGTYIVSHGEDGVGEKALYITDWESSRNRRSTIFVTADSLDDDSVVRLLEQGHDVQMQWARPSEHKIGLKRVGIGPWKPMLWELSLDEQRRNVERDLLRGHVIASRIVQQELDPDWSLTFEKLAAINIIADSSYGPTDERHYGYLFGTGMPFYPLDKSGLLIPVAELPFVLRDSHGSKPGLLRRLVKGSEEGFHQVITTTYNANSISRSPSVEGIRAWQDGVRIAEAHSHWVTTMRDYLTFEEARRASTFRSNFVETDRRLEVEVTIVPPRLTGANEPGSTLLPSLAVPQTYLGASVETIRVNGTPVPFRKLGRSADSFYHLVAVPIGKHTVHVVYLGRADVSP